MGTPKPSKEHLDFPHQPKPDWVHSNYLIWGLFCLALFVRLFYLYEIKDNPFFNIPQIDALFHDDWAQQLLAGDWSSSAQGVFYKAPLYPYFMALIYKLFGHSYLILRLIQLVMGAVSCWFTYLLGRAYFNKRVGVLGFLLAALYGTSIYFDGAMEIIGLHVFLNLLLLLSLTKANQEGKPHWWLLSGLTLGLSALTVPTVLLFLPFVILWLYLSRRKTSRPFLLPALLLTLSTLLTISPATLHNYQHEQGFVLISANGGLNFYLGNNLHAEKTIAIRPGIVWDHFTAQPHVKASHEVSKIEEDRYWSEKAFRFVKDHPDHFTQLLLKKLALFWQAYEIKRNKDIYFFKRYSRLLQLPLFGFGLVAPLALAGIGLSWFKRRREYLLLFYLLTVMLGVILFFVTARYRLPAMPILILFAAYFLNWLWEKARQQDYRQTSYALVAILLMSGLINYDFWGLKASNTFARSHHNLGFVYYKQDNYQGALEEWERALTLYAPGDLEAVDTHFYLAQLYNYQLKDYRKAIKHSQEGLKVLPDMAELETELGWAYYKQGLTDKGVKSLRKAQKSDPLYEEAYQKLAHIYTQEGQFEKARQTHQQAARLIEGYDKESALSQANLYFKQGLGQARQRDWEKAEKFFQMALENNPSSGSTHYNLGLVYLNTKRWEQAVEHLQKATSLDSDKAKAFGALGSAYLVIGQKDNARQALSRALEIDPGLELARQELKRLER